MRNLPLLLILLLLFPLWGLGGVCHAQSPDTIITVTKLPYPKARIFPPSVREGLAPSPQEQSEYPHAAALPDYQTTELQDCITARHHRLLEANLTTLQESKKGRWLKYLPTVQAGTCPRPGLQLKWRSSIPPRPHPIHRPQLLPNLPSPPRQTATRRHPRIHHQTLPTPGRPRNRQTPPTPAAPPNRNRQTQPAIRRSRHRPPAIQPISAAV